MLALRLRHFRAYWLFLFLCCCTSLTGCCIGIMQCRVGLPDIAGFGDVAADTSCCGVFLLTPFRLLEQWAESHAIGFSSSASSLWFWTHTTTLVELEALATLDVYSASALPRASCSSGSSQGRAGQSSAASFAAQIYLLYHASLWRREHTAFFNCCRLPSLLFFPFCSSFRLCAAIWICPIESYDSLFCETTFFFSFCLSFSLSLSSF